MSDKPFIDASDLALLQRQMARYAEATGKNMDEVMAKEAREMAYGLWRELREISPDPHAMLAAAKGRNWRMKRRNSEFAPSHQGWVSQAAMNRAKDLLAGDKSDYFRVRVSTTGAMIVRRVRFSARRQLKSKTNLSRVLLGGRKNNRYSKGALRAKDVSDFELTRALKANREIKQLNVSQLAVTMELAFRQRAAMGHTMAMQWLPRVYKNRGSMVRRGPLVVNSRANRLMGRVDFEEDRDGNLSAITLRGLVPGTAQVMAKRDIFPKVVRALITDREIGIKKACVAAAQKAFNRFLTNL